MTDKEVLEKAKSKIRAEHAAYMRDWRRKNPDKVKASAERYKQNRLKRMCREVEQNG